MILLILLFLFGSRVLGLHPIPIRLWKGEVATPSPFPFRDNEEMPAVYTPPKLKKLKKLKRFKKLKKCKKLKNSTVL